MPIQLKLVSVLEMAQGTSLSMVLVLTLFWVSTPPAMLVDQECGYSRWMETKSCLLVSLWGTHCSYFIVALTDSQCANWTFSNDSNEVASSYLWNHIQVWSNTAEIKGDAIYKFCSSTTLTINVASTYHVVPRSDNTLINARNSLS